MSRFEEAFRIVVGHEGGYVDHPNDPGGETKYGVSKRSYPHLDIKNLTLDDARRIYRENYWDRVDGDDLPAPLALVVFDSAINSGARRALEWLSTTRDWRAYLDTRLTFLRGLPTWGTFGRGWTNRINKLREQAAAWDAPEPPKENTVNLINQAAQAAARREYKLPDDPNMCLMAVRKVVEKALGWDDMGLYEHLVTEKVGANKTGVWWAVDAEKSIRSRGLDVPTYLSPIPGDLLFNHIPDPEGHVGVVVEHLGGLYVLENAQVRRGIHLYGAVNLCPLHLWGPITTIGRLPQAEVPDRPAPDLYRVFVDEGEGPKAIQAGRGEHPEVRGISWDTPAPDKLVFYLNKGKSPPVKPIK